MNITETTTHRLIIERMDKPDNPYDNGTLSRIAHWHSRYQLGGDAGRRLPLGFDSGAAAFTATIGQKTTDLIVSPLFLYNHGTLMLSLNPFPSEPWDSGQVGYLYTTKAAIRARFGVTRITYPIRQAAWDVMTNELANYNAYLRGDVYAWRWESRQDYPTPTAWDQWIDDPLDTQDFHDYGTDWRNNGLYAAIPDDAKPLIAGLIDASIA
jgi:hypothetical protein